MSPLNRPTLSLNRTAFHGVRRIAIFALFSLILGACGQRYHVNRYNTLTKRAAWHKSRAIDKGAKLSRDTTWARIKLKTPAINVQWEPLLPVVDIPRDTTIKFSQDVVVNKSTGKTSTANAWIIVQRDTVTRVIIECPEQEVEEDVPTKIEEEISIRPRYNFWHGLILGLAIGSAGLLIFVLRNKGK